MAHLSHNNDALIARVRRIAGQLNAVEKALTEEASCATVLHRIAAVRGAVGGLLNEVIADHLENHVAAPGLSEAERAEGATELMAVIRRYAE
jgi:DNA-binding FrmR family transcriptional regulator